MEVTAREPVLVDLALQGGGAHGACGRGRYAKSTGAVSSMAT
jgi:hypothetical protein